MRNHLARMLWSWVASTAQANLSRFPLDFRPYPCPALQKMLLHRHRIAGIQAGVLLYRQWGDQLPDYSGQARLIQWRVPVGFAARRVEPTRLLRPGLPGVLECSSKS